VSEAVAASRGEGRSVRRGDLYVAAVVAGAGDLGGADQRILERAAQVTDLLPLFRRTVAEAEGQVRGELLDDLISRPVRDDEAPRSRARRLGVDLDSPHVSEGVTDDHPALHPSGGGLHVLCRPRCGRTPSSGCGGGF
jgi:hypothetical protein